MNNRDICCGKELVWEKPMGYEHHVYQACCAICNHQYNKRNTGTVRYRLRSFEDGLECDHCGHTVHNVDLEYFVLNKDGNKILATKDKNGLIFKKHVEIIPFCPECETIPVADEDYVPLSVREHVLKS